MLGLSLGSVPLGGAYIAPAGTAVDHLILPGQSAFAQTMRGIREPDSLRFGLAAHWAFVEGAGSIARDLSGHGNDGTLIGSPSRVQGVNGIGQALSLNGSGQYVNAGDTASLRSVDSHDKTISAWIYSTKTGAFQGIVDKDDNSGGWGFWITSSNNIELWIAHSVDLIDTHATVPTNIWLLVTAAWHYATKTVDFFWNGIYTMSVTTTGTVDSSSSGIDLNIGALRSSTSYTFGGSIDDVRIYNRALSAREIFDLYRIGLERHDQSPLIFYLGAGGGGGITLTVANTSQAQSATNVSLVQANTLAVADESQAQAAEGVTLVTAGSLSVADASQSQSSTSPALVQAHLLVVDNESQAQVAGTVALTQAFTLAVASSEEAQAAENVVLSLTPTLSVADASQAQQTDNLDLTQAGLLVVANSVQQQTLESITLAQAATLTIANAAQAQTTDNLELTFAFQISPADSTTAQVIDNIALTQIYVLIVNDSVQQQIISALRLRIPAEVSPDATVILLQSDYQTLLVTSNPGLVLVDTQEKPILLH